MLRHLFLVVGLLNAAFAALSCKSGYTLLDRFCYRFDPSLLATFEDALNNCTSTHDSLVSIHNDTVNAFLAKLDTDGVLIGLRYYPDEQEFFWSDGSVLDYNQIDPAFVSYHDFFGDCVKNEKLVWKNAECELKHKFVCRRQASEVTPNKECPDKSLVYTAPETIHSPGYPDKYSFGIESGDCIYKVGAKIGYHVKITFDELKFDGNQGWILVYNSWEDEIASVEADADFNGLNVIISSNLVLLKVVGSRGGTYKVTVTSISAEPEPSPTPSNVCPDKNRVYAAPGTILSPGYPSSFTVPTSPYVQCTYLIAARNRAKILLTFTNANLPGSGFLNIYENYTDTLAVQNRITAVSSGSPTINTHSNHAGVVLYNSNPGIFKFDYSAV